MIMISSQLVTEKLNGSCPEGSRSLLPSTPNCFGIVTLLIRILGSYQYKYSRSQTRSQGDL
jgi:hypothetical protein